MPTPWKLCIDALPPPDDVQPYLLQTSTGELGCAFYEEVEGSQTWIWDSGWIACEPVRWCAIPEGYDRQGEE